MVFGFLIALGAIDLADTLLKGFAHLASLGLGYAIQLAILLIGGLIGLNTRRPAIHAALAIVFLASLAAFVLRAFNTIL
jgi:hypothetical protein